MTPAQKEAQQRYQQKNKEKIAERARLYYQRRIEEGIITDENSYYRRIGRQKYLERSEGCHRHTTSKYLRKETALPAKTPQVEPTDNSITSTPL